MSAHASDDTMDRETFPPDTLPGVSMRSLVTDEMHRLLDDLISEVRETTEALRQAKSDPPPDEDPPPGGAAKMAA